jgi:F-type H+-transporting ATPase subunit b
MYRRSSAQILTLVASLALAAGIAGTAFASGGGGETEGHHGPAKINWFELGYDELDTEGRTLTRERLIVGEDGEPVEQEPMAPPLGLAFMNFAVFAFILVWKAGPPIKSFVQTRHTTIKEALEEGKRLRDEAAGKLEEYSARIRGVEAEVDKLIADVRAAAEDEKKRIIADAERQAEQMKKAAEDQIAAEIERARGELEKEVMTAALAAAEKMITEKATAADHQKLIDGFLVDLADAGADAPEAQK